MLTELPHKKRSRASSLIAGGNADLQIPAWHDTSSESRQHGKSHGQQSGLTCSEGIPMASTRDCLVKLEM